MPGFESYGPLIDTYLDVIEVGACGALECREYCSQLVGLLANVFACILDGLVVDGIGKSGAVRVPSVVLQIIEQELRIRPPDEA